MIQRHGRYRESLRKACEQKFEMREFPSRLARNGRQREGGSDRFGRRNRKTRLILDESGVAQVSSNPRPLGQRRIRRRLRDIRKRAEKR